MEKKYKSILNSILIILGIISFLVICFFVILFIIDKNKSDTEIDYNLSINYSNNSIILTQNQTNFKTILFWFLMGAACIGVIVVGIYLYTKRKEKPEEMITLRKPVQQGRAIELFKRKFMIDTKIPYYWEVAGDDNSIKPCNPNAIITHDEIPFPEKSTGDSWLIFEFEVKEGLQKGYHLALISLDRGEDDILGGGRRLLTSTSLNDNFPSFKNYPLSSPIDKQERYKYYALEEMGEDLDKKTFINISKPEPFNNMQSEVKDNVEPEQTYDSDESWDEYYERLNKYKNKRGLKK